jgi:hypothetical protein
MHLRSGGPRRFEVLASRAGLREPIPAHPFFWSTNHVSAVDVCPGLYTNENKSDHGLETLHRHVRRADAGSSAMMIHGDIAARQI